MEAAPPKKRGRKPKNKTITNKKADFKVNPKNENLIGERLLTPPGKEICLGSCYFSFKI